MIAPVGTIIFLVLHFLAQAKGSGEIPVLAISDSINPGTADYVIESIDTAEKDKVPFLVIALDTPGGLLSTTRQIVQKMLNARIPIVVFVSPKGAHAGSAGALITFAADVAAMAPGTNIGAAHPVIPGGEKIDKTMQDKMANDTAAFAESLAKAKGRNTEWAVKAVRASASIISEEALKQGVIDLMANDLTDLLKQLGGFKLKVPKNGVGVLPPHSGLAREVPMSIKQRLVSFFANPELAYLIMTLGGLCLWVELSHPGLIFPGVLGAICIILSLISFQMLPISYGALALVFLGMGLLVAELFLPTYGVLGIGGLVCFVMGSLFLMDTSAPAFQIPLTLIFPTAAVLASFALFLGYLVLSSRRTKIRAGVDALLGQRGEVREPISAKTGKIFVHGELWNAIAQDGQTIAPGSIVEVTEVREMSLVVRPYFL